MEVDWQASTGLFLEAGLALEGKMAKRPRGETRAVKEMPKNMGHSWCK